MKIGIDANHLSVPVSSGIKRYSENLISALSEIDNKNEYFIFVSKKVKIPDKKNFNLITTPRIFPSLKRQFFLSYFVNRLKPDVFHYLNPYGDIFLNHPKIITTVHDVDLRQIYPYSMKYILNRLNCEITRKAVFRKTKAFLSPSLSAKKELQKHLRSQNNSRPVFITYEAAGREFKTGSFSRQIKRGFLCLSDFSERKNTERVVRAFGMLPENIRKRHKLTIVSTSRKSAAKQSSLLNDLNLGDFSQILYDVSDNELSVLYNRSVCFLYPSLYEGFGIPILESMACGCPVITSNYGAMKEVAQKAAILIDPKSINEITRKMVEVTEVQKLRTHLVKAGLQRSKMFSWKKCAQKTLKVYEDIYNNS